MQDWAPKVIIEDKVKLLLKTESRVELYLNGIFTGVYVWAVGSPTVTLISPEVYAEV